MKEGRQEGRKAGRKEGRQEGRKEGKEGEGEGSPTAYLLTYVRVRVDDQLEMYSKPRMLGLLSEGETTRTPPPAQVDR